MKKILIILFLLTNICFSQNTYKNLVFEGAGIRGIAYPGVVSELDKNGILKNIEKVGGTSAGAIISLIVSLGYTPEEIQKIIYDTDFEDFNDGKYFFLGGFYRMKHDYGWYKGGNFEEWLGKIISAKTKNSNITFEELQGAGFKDLYVTGTDLTKQKMIVFSKKTFPKMKIKDAVRISMSIPLYFEAIFIDSVGNIYNKQNDKNTLDIVVDGGIIGNFPIQIFDSTANVDGKEVRIANPNTLGIRIDSDDQIKYDQDAKGLAPQDVQDMKDYIQAFYVFVLENLNRNQLTEQDWKRTISVSSAEIGPKVKKLSKEQKDALLKCGHECTTKYLNK
jgi:NTE family protein